MVDKELFSRLESLRTFNGDAKIFWSELCRAYTQLSGGFRGRILLKHGDTWKRLAEYDDSSVKLRGTKAHSVDEVKSLASIALEAGFQATDYMIALPLISGDSACVFVAELSAGLEAIRLEAVECSLSLVVDISSAYLRNARFDQVESSLNGFSFILQLLRKVNQQDRFLSAVFKVCAEVAKEFGADQVSIGWRVGDYVKLQAINDKVNFEQKMTVVQEMEKVMEEAFDQQTAVQWPAEADSALILLDHEAYGHSYKIDHIITIPIKVGELWQGVLMIERNEGAFTDKECQFLQVLVDQIGQPLSKIQNRDCWWGRRFKRYLESKASDCFSIEHPWWKAAAILTFLAGMVLFFGKMDYRVEAPFIVRTESQALIPAPFDGYVEEVYYKTGDFVSADVRLLQLDATQLQVEGASLEADIARYQAETEQARGAKQFAEVRIAEAKMQQTEASLALNAYRLGNSAVRTAFAGFVVDDGELPSRIGSPVQKGDLLFQIARLDQLYMDLDVSERDIQDVVEGAAGEIAFASQPNLKFPIVVERIEPMAVAKEEGSVFLVRGQIESDTSATWWRPGMTGVAKVEAGRRSFFWVLTHRFVDWLHVVLWW
jgi:hypothetical protein